jgi:hypothetical protein
MCIFCVTQNAGIAFRVRSSYEDAWTHMRTFEMAQNAGIAFRVRSSYKESLNPTCVLSKWPKMQVLHLG